jgi:hypothetical protein
MRQSSVTASTLEPLVEAGRRKDRTSARCDVSKVADLGSVNDRLQTRADRDQQLGAGLFLSDTHRATLYVLRTHATNVTAALPGVKQQRER